MDNRNTVDILERLHKRIDDELIALKKETKKKAYNDIEVIVKLIESYVKEHGEIVFTPEDGDRIYIGDFTVLVADPNDPGRITLYESEEEKDIEDE